MVKQTRFPPYGCIFFDSRSPHSVSPISINHKCRVTEAEIIINKNEEIGTVFTHLGFVARITSYLQPLMEARLCMQADERDRIVASI